MGSGMVSTEAMARRVVSRVIHSCMGKHDVSIRDVRNHGREVIERVLAGECLTVTRAGRPVAELRPLGRAPLPAAELLRRWRRLPSVDPRRLRDDVDAVIDMDV